MLTFTILLPARWRHPFAFQNLTYVYMIQQVGVFVKYPAGANFA